MPEDVEHVFFQCPRFSGERKELEERVGPSLTLETIVEVMLEMEEDWTSVSSSVTAVMKSRNAEERGHTHTHANIVFAQKTTYFNTKSLKTCF